MKLHMLSSHDKVLLFTSPPKSVFHHRASASRFYSRLHPRSAVFTQQELKTITRSAAGNQTRVREIKPATITKTHLGLRCTVRAPNNAKGRIKQRISREPKCMERRGERKRERGRLPTSKDNKYVLEK